jgi:hypothetical protein
LAFGSFGLFLSLHKQAIATNATPEQSRNIPPASGSVKTQEEGPKTEARPKTEAHKDANRPAVPNPKPTPQVPSNSGNGAVETLGPVNNAPCGVIQVGGVGNQATGGNCGPPQLAMTEAQRNSIRDAMKPYSGRGFTLFRHQETKDTHDFADNLKKALSDAGMNPTKDFSGIEFRAGPIEGISISVGTNNMDAVASLANALHENGIIDKPLRVGKNDQRADAFDITIAPLH